MLDPVPSGRLAGAGLTQLLIFVTAAKELHLTRAARALGLRVFAVGRRIIELEGKVGAGLVACSTHGVQRWLKVGWGS